MSLEFYLLQKNLFQYFFLLFMLADFALYEKIQGQGGHFI